MRCVALEGAVRRPDEKASRPGHGEGDTRPVDRDRDRRAPAAVALEHEVRPLAQRHRRACSRILQPPDVVDPRPGGVDDGAHANLERLPGQCVSELGDRPAFEPGQLDSVDHGRARIGRAAQVREAEPCVIGLGVGVETGGAKAVEPERRHERRRGSGRDHPPPLRDGAGQSRVRPERPADGDAAVRAAAVDRQHELQRRDEMGRDVAAEGMHLGERLADEAEVAEAQVAEPAVDELRRCTRRARGEVVALDDRDVEPVPGRNLGDAGADDPAADDEKVEPPRAQTLERRCSLAHHGDDTAASPRVGLSIATLAVALAVLAAALVQAPNAFAARGITPKDSKAKQFVSGVSDRTSRSTRSRCSRSPRSTATPARCSRPAIRSRSTTSCRR